MIIGQVILIIPIVTTLTISAVSRIDDRYQKAALTGRSTEFPKQGLGGLFHETFGLFRVAGPTVMKRQIPSHELGGG